MKKYLVIIILVIICTGCDANYNINISDGIVQEKADVTILNDSNFIDAKRTLIMEMNPMFESFESKRNMHVKDKTADDYYSVYYENSYLLEDYQKSLFLNECYDNVIINKNEKNIKIKSMGSFNCFNKYKYLDKINITLTTDYEVIDGNYDEMVGNTYKWIFNRGNYTNKTINVKMKNDEQKDKIKKIINHIDYSAIIGISILVFFVLIIILFIVQKSKNNNKI